MQDVGEYLKRDLLWGSLQAVDPVILELTQHRRSVSSRLGHHTSGNPQN